MLISVGTNHPVVIAHENNLTVLTGSVDYTLFGGKVEQNFLEKDNIQTGMSLAARFLTCFSMLRLYALAINQALELSKLDDIETKAPIVAKWIKSPTVQGTS